MRIPEALAAAAGAARFAVAVEGRAQAAVEAAGPDGRVFFYRWSGLILICHQTIILSKKKQ
jgi:hypothetical protein